MTEVSDMFLLCEAIGSRFSTLGEARRSNELEGDPALKGFEMAERGVGKAPLKFGERRVSKALSGVFPPDGSDAGVINCEDRFDDNWVLLDFECKTSGAGDPLRSRAGDFGGTCGGISMPSRMLLVSTFNAGLTLGLKIGDRGFPTGAEASSTIMLETSVGPDASGSDAMYEGPVTQAMRASPNGPVLQPVPGALLDLSWPKVSAEGFRRGGLPGIVATIYQSLPR